MNLLEAKEIYKVCTPELSLKDISFAIEEKGVYGFLGKDGAGKSALAHVLAGASETDGGSVLYKERELYSSDKLGAEIKLKIGYAPEKCVFDGDMTAFELLDLTGKAKKTEPDKRYRQIKEALELTGLSPKGNTLIEQLNLSEKKRLSIANALLGNPEVIILYEPLRYLDANQASEIKKLIAMLCSKKVVLIFSARPADIEELCGTVAIMHEGRLALWEKTEDLLRTLRENELGGLSDALEALSEKGEE